MTPRRKRLLAIFAIIAGVGVATALAMFAFRNNLLYFYARRRFSPETSQAAGLSASAAWSPKAAWNARRGPSWFISS